MPAIPENSLTPTRPSQSNAGFGGSGGTGGGGVRGGRGGGAAADVGRRSAAPTVADAAIAAGAAGETDGLGGTVALCRQPHGRRLDAPLRRRRRRGRGRSLYGRPWWWRRAAKARARARRRATTAPARRAAVLWRRHGALSHLTAKLRQLRFERSIVLSLLIERRGELLDQPSRAAGRTPTTRWAARTGSPRRAVRGEGNPSTLQEGAWGALHLSTSPRHSNAHRTRAGTLATDNL